MLEVAVLLYFCFDFSKNFTIGLVRYKVSLLRKTKSPGEYRAHDPRDSTKRLEMQDYKKQFKHTITKVNISHIKCFFSELSHLNKKACAYSMLETALNHNKTLATRMKIPEMTVSHVKNMLTWVSSINNKSKSDSVLKLGLASPKGLQLEDVCPRSLGIRAA